MSRKKSRKPRLSAGSLLWLVQRNPYLPLSDLRQHFRLDEEEGSFITTPEGKLYLGLPPTAAKLVVELWRQRKIGLQLSVDLHARVVVGIYPTAIPYPQKDAPSPP